MNLNKSSVISAGQMRMPIIGLGTWQASEDEIGIALAEAIKAGYRHIDTAYLYQNEMAIGKILQKLFSDGTLKREDIFVVTKLPLIANRAELVETYLMKSLESLQLDYVDLYLIHSPVGLKNRGPDNHFPKDEQGHIELDMETDLVSLWKGMEAQVDAGRAKFIGVSNFNKKQIKRILENCRIPIANNQIELHIYLQQTDLVSFCKDNNIVVSAYSPLGSPGFLTGLQKLTQSTTKGQENAVGISGVAPLQDPVIAGIAKKHNKTPGQVLVRFLIEYGVAVLPKSTNPERIKQNIDIFDFELTKEEFVQIRELDLGEKGRLFSAVLSSDITKHPEYPHPLPE